MLGKSLQTRDRLETLFCVCGCARKCRPGHSGFLRLEDVASVAPSIKVQRLHMSTHVSLRPVPVAEFCGLGLTCFHIRLPTGGLRTGVAVRGFTRRGPPRSGGKGSPGGAYLYAGPGRGIQQAALTTIPYVYGTPDNRTRTIVYV